MIIMCRATDEMIIALANGGDAVCEAYFYRK